MSLTIFRSAPTSHTFPVASSKSCSGLNCDSSKKTGSPSGLQAPRQSQVKSAASHGKLEQAKTEPRNLLKDLLAIF